MSDKQPLNHDQPEISGIRREQLVASARDAFGVDITEDQIEQVVAASAGLRPFLERVAPEHLRIGGKFADIMEKVSAGMVTLRGDSPEVRRRARDLSYSFIEREFGVRRSTVGLYIRCHEKFASGMRGPNSGAAAATPA